MYFDQLSLILSVIYSVVIYVSVARPDGDDGRRMDDDKPAQARGHDEAHNRYNYP